MSFLSQQFSLSIISYFKTARKKVPVNARNITDPSTLLSPPIPTTTKYTLQTAAKWKLSVCRSAESMYFILQNRLANDSRAKCSHSNTN